MNWIVELFTADSVAHAVLILALVAAAGLALGSIRVGGVSLGIGGVLFAGILFGHFGLSINEHVAEFAREFGLILFVYTIGLQVGPGFFASLRKRGLPLNLMAASIVILGALITVGIYYLAEGVQLPVAVGLFSGGTTNTPSLAAAQQALKEVHGAGAPEIGMPALGYAVAYPFGIVGIILTMLLIRSVFRINPATDAAAFEKEQRAGEAHLENINLEVRNENLAGLPISKLLAMSEPGVVISRRSRGDKVEVAQPDMPLALGDVIHAVGPKPALESLRVVVGKLSDVDVRTLPSEIATERILVSKKSHLGRSIGELDFENLYGVIITRVARGDVEFAASTAVRVQFGDLLTVVGQPDSIARVARELGNSPKQLNHPHLIPVFLGIALGVLLGSMPLSIPGIPAALKLGMAGGPLLAALILSQVGRIGPLIWYMPPSANFMLREVGIVLFLSCVGLKSGTQFFGLLANGQGLLWMGLAAFITLIPILLVGLFARVVRKENFVNICGLLAGSMTDPPALAFANQITKSDTPSISYATVYPLVMLLRVFVAQALVLLIR